MIDFDSRSLVVIGNSVPSRMTDGYRIVLALVNFEPLEDAACLAPADRWDQFRRYSLFHDADPNLELFRLVMREISRQWQISIELDLLAQNPAGNDVGSHKEVIFEASSAHAGDQSWFVLTPFSVDYIAQGPGMYVRRSSSHGSCLIVEATEELASRPLAFGGFPVFQVGELLQEFINGLPAEHSIFRNIP